MVETFYRVPGAPHLALLTDLHGRPFDAVLSSLRARRPSILCIAGDIVYGHRRDRHLGPLQAQTRVLPFLRACASFAPTFLSLGNHEEILDDDDLETIRSTGVTLLDNRWCRTAADGQDLVIGGLTSAYVRDTDGPDSSWLAAFAAEPGFHILLSHHPEYFPLIPENVELVLSGHAHGGQWRILGHGVLAPGQGWWPKWTRGVYEGRLVVSAGLANTAHVPRIMNPCEVVYT